MPSERDLNLRSPAAQQPSISILVPFSLHVESLAWGSFFSAIDTMGRDHVEKCRSLPLIRLYKKIVQNR